MAHYDKLQFAATPYEQSSTSSSSSAPAGSASLSDNVIVLQTLVNRGVVLEEGF